MAGVRLVIDGARMEELLRGPAGPVYHHLDLKSSLVKQAAKATAPVRTGCLRDSIVRRAIEETPGGLSVRIVSSTIGCATDGHGTATRTDYALYVHEGTGPHDIPNAFGYGPSFGIGGRFSGKFHPGNAPNPYLRRALEVVSQ